MLIKVGVKVVENMFLLVASYKDEKWVYMAGPTVGFGGITSAATDYSVMKLSAADGSYDTTWGTNGRFLPGANGWEAGHNRDVYSMKRIPGSEKLYLNHYGAEISGKRYSLTMVTENGGYDGSFGTGGMALNLHSPIHGSITYNTSLSVDNAGNAWTASWPITLAGVKDNKTLKVHCHNKEGTVIYSFSEVGGLNGWVDGIQVTGGFVYIGHSLTIIGDAPLAGIHRFTYAGTLDEDWPKSDFTAGYSRYNVNIIYRPHDYSVEDINPAWAIYDYMTNYRYGAGISESEMDLTSFNVAAEYFEYYGFMFSFKFDQQSSLKDALDFIMAHCFAFLTMRDGKYYLGVYKEEPSSLNINRDHLAIADVEDTEPPVRITKRKYSETFNRIEVSWTDRNNNYDNAIYSAIDRVDISVSGTTRKKTIQLTGIHNEALAVKVAWRMLYDALYRFSNYTFPSGFKQMFLYPGQVLTLSDGFRINNQIVRIKSLSQEERGRYLIVDAVEDKPYLYPLFKYSSERTSWVSAVKPTIGSPLIVFRESKDGPIVSMSLIPQYAQTNGWQLYLSYDDESFDYIGSTGIDSIATANVHGTLDAALPEHPCVTYRPDETIEVTLDSDIGLALTSASDEQFFSNRKLAKIGDEIIAYHTVENISGDTWRIKGLIRGLFYTTPAAHSISDDFYTLDSDITYIYDETNIGKTVYIKTLSFYGDEIQELADVSSVSYTISGEYKKPGPLSLMRITGREGHTTVSSYPITIDSLFTNWIGGFGRSPYGNCVWGIGPKDETIEKVRVQLKETDGTKILDETYSLKGYNADEYQLEILDVDRNGKDPIDVFISAIGALTGPERNCRVDIV